MKITLLTIVFIILSIILFFACIYITFYLIRRSQKLQDRIQTMLDNAASGKFENIHLDETKISSIENSMWHYLCNNQVSYMNISKEKEQIQLLISDISHQTLTPISNILLYSQLLGEWYSHENCTDNQEIAEGIEAIQEQAEKLDFLVQSLVKLSRMETGIIKVSVHKQRISPVLSAVKQQYITKAANKKIQFNVASSDEMAVFDLKWTIEALSNIVDNAIKYTNIGGQVSISVIQYTIFLRIDISDNGIGIKETEQAKIFTRFYRSPQVGEQQGVGIGLHLAREIIKVQNGYIKLSSKLGKGSLFSIFLLRD